MQDLKVLEQNVEESINREEKLLAYADMSDDAVVSSDLPSDADSLRNLLRSTQAKHEVRLYHDLYLL